MADPKQLADQVARVFKRIEDEQMAGIPLLNPALRVKTLGFQTHEGRTIGVVITPWMMSLLLFPSEQDEWFGFELGEKVSQAFPSNTYSFVVNDIEGIGVHQAHSLYSPMRDFDSQEQALAAGERFLETLMEPREQPEADPDDEALLGRILRGEEPLNVDFDEFHDLEPTTEVAKRQAPTTMGVGQATEPISRRDLLRGKLRHDK